MLGYEGKKVLVVGGATGMGAAAAQAVAKLGAEVTVLDVAEVAFPVKQFVKIDLRDKASVDRVIGELKGPYDALFSCAGVADGTRGIMLINFISQRHLIEGLVASGALPPGSSIGVISSTAGNGWNQTLDELKPFLSIPDWEGQDRWVQAHKTENVYTSAEGYVFSKRAMCAWVAEVAYPLLKKGVRINAILPGPTDTPLARANADIWLAYAQDYRDTLKLEHLQPREMGDVLIFLCSPMASGVSGENIVVDQAYTASTLTGSFVPGPDLRPGGPADVK